MASLVSEILLSAGQLEKRDLQAEIDKVNSAIEDAKFDVVHFLEQFYCDFNPLLVHSRQLATASQQLRDDLEKLTVKADTELKFQLQCSTGELTTISGQIGAARAQVDLLENVARLHDLLAELDKPSDLDEGAEWRARLVAEADALLDGAEEEAAETQLHVWQAVRQQVQLHRGHLCRHLDAAWDRLVAFQPTKPGDDEGATLQLGPAERLADVFRALDALDRLQGPLAELMERLLDDVLTPLMAGRAVLRCRDGLLDVVASAGPVTDVASVEPVLEHVSSVVRYLSERMDFELEGGERALHLVGRRIGDDLGQRCVRLCLKPTLPSSAALLSSDDFLEHLERVRALERLLLDAGLLPAPPAGAATPIGQFVAGVDVFYADKECLQRLARARQLMCAPLHETVHLRDQFQGDTTLGPTAGAETASVETAHMWKMLGDGGCELKWSPFVFPECQVSRSTQQLIDLIGGLVDEALQVAATSERCAARLLYTARSVCELYLSVVGEYHRDALAQLPFHAAVAHNNGMFVAHSLLTLATSHLIKVTNQNTVPLMDLVAKFRHAAAHLFIDHMKRQRDQLIAFLKDAGFNRLGGASRLPASAEKAVRQCLHHLTGLQNIWQPVLPSEVYLRAVGTLANSVLEELVARVLALEDIPADAALQLVDQCQHVTDKLPLLFAPPPQEDELKTTSATAGSTSLGRTMHFVAAWGRFQELQQLLGASLKNIEDRWSAAKGPLAAHFAADEVKHLIRALFQNTDHRAAVLARIK